MPFAVCAAIETERANALRRRGNDPTEILVGEEVNDVIFSRLINVLTAVMDAAHMSNIWIVVDRSDPVASSPT